MFRKFIFETSISLRKISESCIEFVYKSVIAASADAIEVSTSKVLRDEVRLLNFAAIRIRNADCWQNVIG